MGVDSISPIVNMLSCNAYLRTPGTWVSDSAYNMYRSMSESMLQSQLPKLLSYTQSQKKCI
jgi:hypothetical protein